ncbi:hypothetical protein NVP1101O_155 [Vibrio phage 1.101.O._10N.261.45.C6]|nr:hypothetical protein NVP1101O_155 [Vibrio phage 1.101.O._10N.261.45.C6]
MNADFLLTKDGDLDLTNGLTVTEDMQKIVRQQFEQALDLWWGEWFLDVTSGVPYMQNPEEDLPSNIRYFLGEDIPTTPRYISDTLDKYIRSLPFIQSMESSYSFNTKTREFTYKPVANAVGGQVIEFPAYNQTI